MSLKRGGIMTRSILIALCLVSLVGCQGGTRVIKDGFMARQVTEEDMRFLRSTRSWDTECRWDQLIQERSSGNWYCPAPATKEDYNTRVYQAHVDGAKSDVVLGAAIRGLAFVAGMGTLGAVMPGMNVSQSVAGSPIRTSTLVVNGAVPGGVAP